MKTSSVPVGIARLVTAGAVALQSKGARLRSDGLVSNAHFLSYPANIRASSAVPHLPISILLGHARFLKA